MIFVVIYTLMIVVDTAHIISPMALTWMDPQLRREALSRRREFVLAPGLVISTVLMIGAITSLGYTDYVPGYGKMFYIGYQWRMDEPIGARLVCALWDTIKIPMPWLMLGYLVWQIWHFGSQNFGVVAICLRWANRRMQHRQLVRAACVVGTGLFMVPAMIVLFHVPQGYLPGRQWIIDNHWIAVTALALVFVPHWVVALWLTERASRWRWWLLFIVPVGAVGLAWQVPTAYGLFFRVLQGSPNGPIIVAFGVALSIWHYMTDAKLWKRDSTAMRAVFARGGRGAYGIHSERATNWWTFPSKRVTQ